MTIVSQFPPLSRPHPTFLQLHYSKLFLATARCRPVASQSTNFAIDPLFPPTQHYPHQQELGIKDPQRMSLKMPFHHCEELGVMSVPNSNLQRRIGSLDKLLASQGHLGKRKCKHILQDAKESFNLILGVPQPNPRSRLPSGRFSPHAFSYASS
jgi:hypothetical protein